MLVDANLEVSLKPASETFEVDPNNFHKTPEIANYLVDNPV